MVSYFRYILALGTPAVLAILIVLNYSNGGKGFFCLFEGNSNDSSSSAMLGPPGLVIGVLSSRDNFMQRQAVRHTWAAKLYTSHHQKLLPSQLVFVLGDQDCFVHPRLRSSNPNHCPQLPDNGAPAADGEEADEFYSGSEYDEKWLSTAAVHGIDDGSDRPMLQQERCLAGLGFRTLTDVMWSSIIFPFTKKASKPRVFLKVGDDSHEMQLELETREGEGPVWIGDNLRYFLPDGIELEIVVDMDDQECLEMIKNKRCEWLDGNGSVQYSYVRHWDGSVRPWQAHDCLPFTLQLENGAEQCPPGWSLHRDHCYYFSEDFKSWQNAQADCEARHGSDLATVHDDKINAYLLNDVTAGRGGRGQQRWIGLHSLVEHSHFEWADGSDVSYTNWDTYEPNYIHNGEHCVELLPYSGLWNDNFCNVAHQYVCQKKRMSEDGRLRRTLTASQRQSLQHSWRETRATVEENVLREQKLFGDLLLVPGLVDTYGSLPDKLKALIHWSNAVFPGYWVMKTDDDTHVSVRRVLDVLAQATAAPDNASDSSGSISGPYSESRCPEGHTPPAVFSQFQGLRSVPRLGKWREMEYTGLTFPEFPTGGGYILSGSVVSGLAAAAPTLRSYQGEDVSLGVWLSSLTFPCPPTNGPRTLGAQSWQEAVVRSCSQLMNAAAPVMHALKEGISCVFETLFLARVSTTASTTSPQQPVLLSSPSAPVPHSPALLISVPCWLRSNSCNDSYVVAPDLSIDKLDALHKVSISR